MTANDTLRTVLVTGVNGQWGRRVARALLARPGLRVLGIDRRAPERLPEGLDFIKADVRNPLLADLLRVEGVESLVHLAFRERQWRREEDFESNVLGAMQLVGACADAGVGQVVIKSSMAVYGARSDNPMYVYEDWPLRARSAYAYVRDAVEIEGFLQEFSAEYPEMRLAVLRFPSIAGAGLDTPFTRLLELPVLPNLLGFDPLFQIIDAEDVVAALVHAVLVEASGPFNVAADGVVSYWQLAGLLGRPVLPIFHLFAYWGWQALSSVPPGRRVLRWLPLEPDYLRYSWTGDLTRMRDDLGFEPRYDATAAIQHYVEQRRVAPFQDPADLRPFADDQLADIIARRGRSNPDKDAFGSAA